MRSGLLAVISARLRKKKVIGETLPPFPSSLQAQRSWADTFSSSLTLQQSETLTPNLIMVLSLEDIDNVLSTNARKTPPIPPQDTSETQSDPLNTEATEESASQQNSPFTTPTLDPALLTLSPQTPIRTTNPILHGEDLTQLARHLTLQKSLSKNSADELMLFAKVFSERNTPIFLFLRWTQRSLGEQLVWIAASQLSLAESVLAVCCGEVSPTLLASLISSYHNKLTNF